MLEKLLLLTTDNGFESTSKDHPGLWNKFKITADSYVCNLKTVHGKVLLGVFIGCAIFINAYYSSNVIIYIHMFNAVIINI